MTDIGIPITSSDFLLSHSRVVLDYTNRDFAAIRAQLLGLAKGFMPEWETAGESGDFGTLLLELFSYMGDVMHFYIDRVASESFLSTAQRLQSVMYIADMLGYSPIGQQAASVNVTFSMDQLAGTVKYPNDAEKAAAYSVTLPAGTIVSYVDNQTGTSYPFTTDLEITLTSGESATVSATQGVEYALSQVAVSNGVPNWTIEVGANVVFNSVTMYTREGGQLIDWSHVYDLADATPTQSVFSTYTDDRNRTFILLGDNASGRIPPVNAPVYVGYRTSNGAAANLIAPNTITSIKAPSGINIGAITVTNSASPVGGSDRESIESIRYNAPRLAGRLNNRAITLSDYADLALRVPGVAKAQAYGTMYSVVYVRVAPIGGTATDAYMESICTGVEHFLQDKILVGSTVVAEPRTFDELWVDAFIRIKVYVLPEFNRTKIRRDVESAVSTLFSFDNLTFGSRVTIGQVHRSILSVTGVEWAELLWLDKTSPGSVNMERSIYESNEYWSISNIDTDDLHIPRIDTTVVEENVAYFPDLTLEERTHNGLWVRAIGGMPNT